MMKFRWFVLTAVLFLILLCSCTRDSGLKTDMFELLRSCGVSAGKAQVWDSSRSRLGLVEIGATKEDFERLANCLKLRPGQIDKSDDAWEVLMWRREARGIHEHPYLIDGAPVIIFRSDVRAKELLLKSGVQLEYFMVYVPKDGGPLLIQVAYAYG